MERLIDLELAGELERKVYLAFLKGLTQIKLRSQFKKEEQARLRGHAQQEGQENAGEEQQEPTIDL